MNKENNTIERYYKEAVSGLNEEWLSPESTKWYEYVVNLEGKHKTTYLISILNQQVLNGGFDQYFINGYGQFIKETIISLKNIKSTQLANLLEEIYKKINNNSLDDETFRRKLLKGEIDSLYDNEEVEHFLESADSIYVNLHEILITTLEKYLD